jgi:hypothetical protein
MKEKFIAFLKEHKIYDLYSRHVFAEWGMDVPAFLETEKPKNYLTYAFKWDEADVPDIYTAPEFTKYWAAVDELWKILNDDFKA